LLEFTSDSFTSGDYGQHGGEQQSSDGLDDLPVPELRLVGDEKYLTYFTMEEAKPSLDEAEALAAEK
jgi:hypothetical protein